MKFNDFYWPDSEIDQILIYYDTAELVIWNDLLQRRVVVHCKGFGGMTDLCIWDDQTILDDDLQYLSGTDAFNSQDPFIQKLCDAYPNPYPGAEKNVKDGIIVLKFLLTNQIWFSIYCQSIDVTIHENQDRLAFP